MEKIDITKLTLNIPQLKTVVLNSINDNWDFLSGEIRTIGLKDKVDNRQKTLLKIHDLLEQHRDSAL